MVGDSDRALTSLYGVLWPLLRVARRVTYVIDDAGVIRGVFPYELQAAKHLDEVLDLLGKLQRERPRA